MQHYYSDPIRHEEMHLVKPVHYERDLYVDPETKHETMLVQPIHHDQSYLVEKAEHDMFETIDPGHHYDVHHPHRESYQEPVHHYDYENPYHMEQAPVDEVYDETNEEPAHNFYEDVVDKNDEIEYYHPQQAHEYIDHDWNYL